MSRIGKMPVEIPANVKVNIVSSNIIVEGQKGKLSLNVKPVINVVNDGKNIVLTRKNDLKESKSLHGLYRVLLNNMVVGVSKGFERKLEINGTGFKAAISGQKLTLNIGYSHVVDFSVPEGAKVTVDDNTKLTISGIDKQLVGHVASVIRGFRPPEPYKGKGIKYSDEVIRRKAGKAAKK
ncbi:MAG: 50S ribosomal protein L6 [Spirochaetes bacterium GWF1_31_7]|nr:MAG: 50S ribosomal protein L6 [Spirochaetes bacterium GWE1_32_154]OHD47307.1 MAG: 50S ribosomal protein L6 [Spirochaetes bacterium GWE2_31_10]OHD47366.1 MAG: 50S ribosomal protein L6 [Spirochaetes bacterium GWF1_31_7]OHD81750.1 MAG: 50S ribosomal protein L6 [Spirochaetes bacterium RIFOXYB1_FULL_32_8]HBD92819.1 50S ribosomal protein L6 [Spirochaetia bacterium]